MLSPLYVRRRTGLALLAATALLCGCSTSQIVVRGAMPLMDGGFTAMNRETDVQLAREAIPATLKMLEGMSVQDPSNTDLRLYLAQGFYAYSYSFVELEARERALALYTRGLGHAKAALDHLGFGVDPETASLDDLGRALNAAGQRQVPALFWAASCMAKRTDVHRTDPLSIAQLARAARMMERVLALDENFYYGGPHMFFGVYYGGRAPMFGGDFAKAEMHFAKAHAATQGKLLLGDVLYAEFLARQQLDRSAFHEKLSAVIAASDDVLPEMALANRVAQQRAHYLLSKEAEWF